MSAETTDTEMSWRVTGRISIFFGGPRWENGMLRTNFLTEFQTSTKFYRNQNFPSRAQPEPHLFRPVLTQEVPPACEKRALSRDLPPSKGKDFTEPPLTCTKFCFGRKKHAKILSYKITGSWPWRVKITLPEKRGEKYSYKTCTCALNKQRQRFLRHLGKLCLLS